MNMHKATVIGVEHFRDEDNNVVLLNEFIRDPVVIEYAPALWVPKNVLDDRTRAQSISEIASSAPEYAKKAYDKDKTTFRLIYDTASAGGVDATLAHIDYIATHHPAPAMTFCISETAYAETFEALIYYAEQHNKTKSGKNNSGVLEERINFLLAAPYPENSIEAVERLEGENISTYVGRLSLNAETYGMGMVGAADLAQFTRIGQLYIALGVCVNGAVDYEVTNPLAPGYIGKKRLTTPEDTYTHATNTASHVGRTLFDTGNGEFRFPYKSSPDEYPEILELVKANFMKLQARLDDLPPATSIKPLEERIIEYNA